MSFTKIHTRKQHVDWCKKRALEYVDDGDLANAITSMISDMGKHDETKDIGFGMAMIGMMEVSNGPEAVRRFIEGFN